MIQIKPTTKTLICIGSGGVGKTTMAASIATGFAYDGKKVLVLTIDPSHRLAQTLGVKTDGDVHRVNLPAEAKGELFSCVINHQKTFDWFIQKAASKSDAQPLLENRLYQQLSGRLSGSQDFTSLVSLLRYVQSEMYDLVILDTPPSQHTWNFLHAPEKIAMLFNEGVAKWFRADDSQTGLIQRMLNLSTTQVLKALETLTGSQFMKELSAFFAAIKTWQKPLENAIADCHRLLISPQTEFLLVTGLDTSRLVEAQKLSREILKQGYNLTSVVINRVPTLLLLSENSSDRISLSPRLQELADYYKSLENDLSRRLSEMKRSLKIYKCAEMRQTSEDVITLKNNYSQINPL